MSGSAGAKVIVFFANLAGYLRPVTQKAIKYNPYTTGLTLAATAYDLVNRRDTVSNVELTTGGAGLLCGVISLGGTFAKAPLFAFAFSNFSFYLAIAKFGANASEIHGMPDNKQKSLLAASYFARFNSQAHALGIPTGLAICAYRLSQNQSINDSYKSAKEYGSEIVYSQPATSQTALGIVDEGISRFSGKNLEATFVDCGYNDPTYMGS